MNKEKYQWLPVPEDLSKSRFGTIIGEREDEYAIWFKIRRPDGSITVVSVPKDREEVSC